MKIAMLTNNYRPFVGGVPVSVERQAQELTRLGHQVTVIAPMYGDDEEERSRVLEQDERSPERVVRYRTQKMKMPNGMVYPSFRPEEVFGIFERETFDCIHVHHPVFAGIWALSLGKKYDIPVIYTYHTRYEDYLHYIPFFREKEERRHIRNRFTDWVKGSVIPSYMKWFCSQCDLVVAPSAGMLQVIVLAEALAAGCPVVAVHATGADDVVRNGVNGFLTAEDEDAWAEKAAEALRPENLGRMREAARSDADNYRASRLAIYAEMLYNQCVLRKGENGYERSEDRGGHVAAAVRKVS